MIGLAIPLATVLSYALGWAVGVPLLVPVFNTLAGFPFMVAALRRGDVGLAVGRMLLWALTLAACATLLSYAQPWRTDTLFLHGAAYRAEMFGWVMTGRGAESDPSRFLPQHVLHAAAFMLLALASGGVLALAMGAVLMNYMGHYVGALAACQRASNRDDDPRLAPVGGRPHRQLRGDRRDVVGAAALTPRRISDRRGAMRAACCSSPSAACSLTSC